MHQASIGATRSATRTRSHHMRSQSWAVASLAGLLAGCVEPPPRLVRVVPSYLQFVSGDLRDEADAPGPSKAAFPPDSISPGRNVSPPNLFSESYWTAMADLDLTALRKAAQSYPEISFAEGVALLAGGEQEKAEAAFVATSDQIADLNVAVASRIMLATTLLYERKWAALRDLSTASRLNSVDRQHTSGLERWGQAFANVDQQVTTFPQKPAVLPLRMTAIGTPTIRVRINGKEYDFWLDTGSSITVLSSDVASEAHVSTISDDTLTVRTFAGTAPVRPAAVNRMELGPIVLTNSPAVVMDASLMRLTATVDGNPRVRTRIDGIIGWDTIRQFDVSMNYGSGTISLERPESRGNGGTWYQNLVWVGKPLIEVRTQSGQTLHFTLDTGAQASFVNAAILNEANAAASTSDTQVFGIAETSGRMNRVVPFLTLNVAGKALRLQSVIVYGPVYSGLINCDGILGSDIAQFGTIRIDATNGLFSIGD